MTTLIIAEKPSVAGKIAGAIGNAQRKKGEGQSSYYEVDDDGELVLVASAVGHVYSLAEKGNKSWNTNYPVFDIEWDPAYEVQKGSAYTKGYVKTIEKLAKKADTFVNACDYDIEGSVIGYNLINMACHADPKKGNVKRMHFSTVTFPDLKKAYENIEDFDFGQTEAGITRHKLDWYYGINLSRALTSSMRTANAHGTLSIGRVQGPALKLVVDRERDIKKFIPEPFWVISARMNGGHESPADFDAIHTKEKFEGDSAQETAEEIYAKVKDQKTGKVTSVVKKEYKQPPPNPFDLTSLQLEAHRFHRIPPKHTLELAQTLYENGIISYPRTSSQEYPPTIGWRKILEKLKSTNDYSSAAQTLLSKASLKPNNGKKKDPAHPAIYPTGEAPKGMGVQEMKLYDLIVRRFMATFGEWAIRESAKIIIDVNTEDFKAEGKRTVAPNWHELYGKYAKFDEIILPDINEGDIVNIKKLNLDKKMTQPPKRFTEASIIKELEKQNLGTKATRATIVDTLFKRNYIQGKAIEATTLGIKTVETLEVHSPEILDAELTAKINDEMEGIIENKATSEAVEKRAKDILTKVLKKFKKEEKEIGAKLAGGSRQAAVEKAEAEAVGACPICKEGVLIVRKNPKTGKRFLGCSNYPKCTNTQPLPQRGKVISAKKECETCSWPMINIWTQGKKMPWTICTNFSCPSKQKK